MPTRFAQFFRAISAVFQYAIPFPKVKDQQEGPHECYKGMLWKDEYHRQKINQLLEIRRKYTFRMQMYRQHNFNPCGIEMTELREDINRIERILMSFIPNQHMDMVDQISDKHCIE